jgi:phosphoribosylpyrophosphate synthetase
MPKLDGCLLVYFDDFFDTGGSVVSNLEDIANLKRGQPAYVFAAMPHGLLYKNAHKIIKAMGINLIASTSNPTRRTKPQIEGLPITWYDAAPYFFEEMRRGIREGIPPEKLFTPKNYPTWSVHDLYKIVQAPANLEPYHPDFSLHALM